MYVLKDFQEEAVKPLLEHTFVAISQPQPQTEVLLESPTGSGKTVMLASYMERLIDELRLRPSFTDNVAFIWMAPNTLHIQSYDSLRYLYDDSKKLNCINLDSLGINPSLKSKDLLFLNWASVNSSNRIWRSDNEYNTNLETLIENTKLNDTKIVMVIDEAHLSAFRGAQAIAVRELISADVEVLVTATVNFPRPQLSVFVPRHKVVNQELIKKGVRLNVGLDPSEQNGENVHIHLLRKALAKKEELKRLYDEELGEEVVNPLILIQLPSDNNNLTTEDRNIRDVVVGLLNSEFNITTQNGKLAIWLSGERDKDDIEKLNGIQDVLIFKQAVAQGWDCPRATVLLSYRTVNSPSFGIQTVGRILRMPHRKHYNQDDLNYGYVYTNIESTRINFVETDKDYINSQYAERQNNNGWTYDRINTATIINDRSSKGILTSAFQNTFFSFMEERYGISQIPSIDFFTPDLDGDQEQVMNNNLQAMVANGWEFDININQITIPVDVEVDPYIVNSIALNTNNTRQFAITVNQFSNMFERLCYDNITRLNRSKSWKKLRDVLLFFGEYYLNLSEHDTKKFFLFPQNRYLLEQIIASSLERFEQWQREIGNENRRVEYNTWEIPEFRYYSENHQSQQSINHALKPFYEANNISNPEQRFRRFLENNSDYIEYWYKNGDSGKEHFAIPYLRNFGDVTDRPSLFYVDFVIKFRSGRLGLFDTKSVGSDADAPLKHNALLDYIESTEEIDVFGGVIIEAPDNQNHWRYSENRIDNTTNLDGWSWFNPENL